MSDKPIELSVKELFSKNNYTIPLYQRNYAWGEPQVLQLVQDIWDNAQKPIKHNYYLGTLVVHHRNVENTVVYETIDGQQRLTTLNILLSVLKNEYGIMMYSSYEERLKFDGRKISTDTLKLIWEKGKNHVGLNINPKIEQAYLDMHKKLEQLVKGNTSKTRNFYDYFINYVKLLHVEVPDGTDLNHYFEIMNNRGEQLEKHEIVKATLLERLKDDKDATATFGQIWVACSNMDKYMQLAFEKKKRDRLFGLRAIIVGDFDAVTAVLMRSTRGVVTGKPITFMDLINNREIKVALTPTNEQQPENIKFGTIINYPNFLLHVLRIYTGNNVALDDKRLVQAFDEEIKKSHVDPITFVKGFAFALLKCRWLYDNYIIKREAIYSGDSWSLKTIEGLTTTYKFVNTFRDEVNNRQIVMLLAMFHVSFPQQIYKHWLSGVLNYLYKQKTIEAASYIVSLEHLSDAFYFDRIRVDEVDYYDIIFKNNGVPVNNKVERRFLHLGTQVQNFIFNRLDYLLWRSIVVSKQTHFRIKNVNKFTFSFRSSVEHYYPQNPRVGVDKIALKPGMVDHFGNLCLISRSKNSSLSNNSPSAKAEHYGNSSVVESLKQQLMMKQSSDWSQLAIVKHEDEMISLLGNKL